MEYLNKFPGYELVYFPEDKKYHNMYRGTDVSRGGFVYSEPGVYENVALLDAASLHPHSIVALNKMGEYTERYEALLKARIALKHHDYDAVKNMLGGVFSDFLKSDEDADKLALATKLFLNSCYGFCSATFPNPFADSRDKGNIVALRGALFMRTLMDEVETIGHHVIHVKTDSCKVANADAEVVKLVQEFGKKYQYEMEFEAVYDRMCLVNDAVYIAKYMNPDICEKIYGFVPKENAKHGGEWTATGAQFQQPYVFKTLFSHEEIEFKDICLTKEISRAKAMYLDMNERLPEGEHNYIFIGRVGLFCPIKAGHGGGELVKRSYDDKYSAVTGTKGYRWLEAEQVRLMSLEDSIDMGYFHHLVDEAVDAISQYDDFERFVGDHEYVPIS